MGCGCEHNKPIRIMATLMVSKNKVCMDGTCYEEYNGENYTPSFVEAEPEDLRPSLLTYLLKNLTLNDIERVFYTLYSQERKMLFTYTPIPEVMLKQIDDLAKHRFGEYILNKDELVLKPVYRVEELVKPINVSM